MTQIREIQRTSRSQPTIEGAGVHLKRAFGYDYKYLDPFLLLDDFHSSNPEDYILGFPWHPHRGIETITYMLNGEINHGDSMGNKGVIHKNEVQWMTAGSGIIHSEMPQKTRILQGFQLWANLPAKNKMMNPRYREVRQDQIPLVSPKEGVSIKIISGQINGVKGPVKDIITDPEYIDIFIQPNIDFTHEIKMGYNAFAYVIEGAAIFDPLKKNMIENETLVVFKDGEQVSISTKEKPVHFLMASGRPIREPVAWRGPIVMNTEKELTVAFNEYNNGTFIKHDPK
jgi:redox-sensitive bicupin YhaK (pirin superfamily)